MCCSAGSGGLCPRFRARGGLSCSLWLWVGGVCNRLVCGLVGCGLVVGVIVLRFVGWGEVAHNLAPERAVFLA